MRFEQIRIDAFGGLRDLDTGERPLGPFVVVQGPNEAGKSSFFEFLVALLYGFYPATDDRNPYAPWNGDPASGRGLIRLSGGACLDVRRRLLSSPAGSVLRGDEETPLRNETLEVAAHVSMRVYRQVFALTLAELAALEDDGWDAVQDRLLGALGARDLVPARQVAEALEERAGGLWRPNRRGNQEVRRLDVRLGELAYRRSALREQERGLREAHRDLEAKRARLDTLRDERETVRDDLEHARRHAPIREVLSRIEELEARAGPVAELEGLPTDPREHLERLRAGRDEASATLHGLAREEEALRERAGALDSPHRSVLALADEIAALQGDVRASETDLVRIGRLEQESRDLTRRIETLLAPFGARQPLDGDALQRVPAHEVRPAAGAARRARQDLDDLSAREARARERIGRLPGPTIWLALGGVASVALAVALVVPWPGVAAGAGVVLGGAVVGWIVRRAVERAETPTTAEREEREAALERAEQQLRASLGEVLDGRLGPDQLESLPSALERARELLGDRDDREASAAAARERIDALGRRARELAERAGLERLDAAHAPGAAAARLGQALAEARARASAAQGAELELEHVGERRRRAAVDRDTAAAELARFEQRLADLADGDPDVGAREASARLQAARRARELAGDLEATHNEQEIETARAEVPSGHDPVAALSRRERAITDDLEALAREVLELEARIATLSRRETLDVLDGEIAEISERRTRLVRERDRSWVLARVVRDAERWVREEHQPELLRNASALLETLTGGRYLRVVLDPSGRGFRVRGPATPRPLPVDTPLSAGTREQVYLALRLALLDTLDGSGERLPLVLDEVLVNWDPTRRSRGLDALARLAEHRQLFLLTCHPDIADEAVARGAMRLVLPAPEVS